LHVVTRQYFSTYGEDSCVFVLAIYTNTVVNNEFFKKFHDLESDLDQSFPDYE